MDLRKLSLTFVCLSVAAMPLSAFAAIPNSTLSGISKASSSDLVLASVHKGGPTSKGGKGGPGGKGGKGGPGGKGGKGKKG